MSKKTDSVTDAQIKTVSRVDFDDEMVEIRHNARELSLDDECVTDHTTDAVGVTDASLSSILFDKEGHVQPYTDDDTAEIMFVEGASFPDGEGWVEVTVRVDPDGLKIKSMSVSDHRER